MENKRVQLGEIIQFKNGKKRPSNEGAVPVYGGNGILGYAGEANYRNSIIIGRVGAYAVVYIMKKMIVGFLIMP